MTRTKYNTDGTMTIGEIARAVKAAFLAWLKERTEHLFKICQKEHTVTFLLANARSQELTTVQKGEMKTFIDHLKEKFGIKPILKKNTDLVVMWELQLQ